MGLFLAATAASSAFAAANETVYKPDSNAPRASVPEKYKWDVSGFFKDSAAWSAAFVEAEKDILVLNAFKGSLGEAKYLKPCLEDYFKARQQVDRLSAYANMKASEDDSLLPYQEMSQRALGLGNRFRSDASFIRQELLRLDEDAAAKLLADESLAPYRAYITDLRRRRSRLLGTEAERVLSLAGEHLWAETDLNEIPSDIEQVFKAVKKDIQLPKVKDEDGKEVQLTFSNYEKYRASKKREVRKGAVEAFLGALSKYEAILAATLGGEVKRDVFMARARGYDRSIEAYLDRQDVPPSVAENLVASVHQNLGPLHRYVELRKKILGLKDLHLYDLYTALVPSADAAIPYEAGLEDIKDALEPMGEGYVSALFGKDMLGRGMVDVYPSKGKDSGAFALSAWGFPPMVLLNYQDDIKDVSTAAHELGHAMHAKLNIAAQPIQDSGYSSLIAETASTTNEMMLARHLIAKYQGNDKMQLYILGRLVESIRTTIYRQALFTEFELKVHGYAEEGTPITAELLNKTYADLVKLYYGPGFTVDKDDGAEWSYIPHFYWKHYVYSYACGLASGISFSEKIVAGDTATRDRYLAMLAKPREAHPVDIMREAGVDLLKPEALKAAAKLMDETLTEMEGLVAKQSKP
ncbi:MAG: hypothetical protein A2X36_14845 [Elusimicrobia bacterium GWA2_69_24]|nr:MAG: hypothetical protein A2X36_14845 [Elusimicrobia bacterium GWA2_69_24]